MVEVDTLMAHPANARIHPKNQRDALKGAIDDIGFIRSVTITKDGTVVDGHLRVALALSEGQKTIPVEIVDLDEAETKEALLTLDPIAALAATDKEKLDALLHEVQSGDAAVQAMLSEMAKDVDLYGASDDDGMREEVEEPVNEPDRWPVAIVLNIQERRKWESIKRHIGAQDDKAAFLRMMEVFHA